MSLAQACLRAAERLGFDAASCEFAIACQSGSTKPLQSVDSTATTATGYT